jgi:hypothetical protein
MQVVAALAVAVATVGVAAAMYGAGPAPGSINTSLHQHPNLEIFVNGEPIQLPSNIGIDPSLWNNHAMDEYGEMASMSPLHTHDSSGVIHLEMGKWHACTLGDFFDVWGQPFDRDRMLSHSGPITMTVDGHPSEAYRDLVLQDGQRIVIRTS